MKEKLKQKPQTQVKGKTQSGKQEKRKTHKVIRAKKEAALHQMEIQLKQQMFTKVLLKIILKIH